MHEVVKDKTFNTSLNPSPKYHPKEKEISQIMSQTTITN